MSKTCHFHKETHQIAHSLPSNSASECPISSMFLCFHGLSIPMRVPACSLAYIKFSREAFVRNMSFLQGNTLNWPFSIKLFCFKMSNQFNVSLFPWSKYTNEERQPVPWLILIFSREAFVRNMSFSKSIALPRIEEVYHLDSFLCNWYNCFFWFSIEWKEIMSFLMKWSFNWWSYSMESYCM